MCKFDDNSPAAIERAAVCRHKRLRNEREWQHERHLVMQYAAFAPAAKKTTAAMRAADVIYGTEEA